VALEIGLIDAQRTARRTTRKHITYCRVLLARRHKTNVTKGSRNFNFTR